MALPRGGRVAVPGSGTNFFEGGVFAELFVAWVLFRTERGTPAGGSGRACGPEPGNAPRFPMRLAIKNGKVPRGFSDFFRSGEFF